MFCKNCNRQIPDDAAFCPECGTKRPGGDAFYDEQSGRDIKDLPDYAKGKDVYGNTIDSNRDKSGPAGRDDGGIVRISASTEPAAPTGFVNPLKNSGKTVFHDSPEGNTAEGSAQTAQAEPGQTAVPIAAGNGPAAPESGNPTGFVNPLKDSDQAIHLGSDGDRNEANAGGFNGDPSEIESHLAFAIFVTLCCCLPLGIVAIVFASQVSSHIRTGNYEEAQKCSERALLFCWISLGVGLFCNIASSVVNTILPLIMENVPSP